MSARSPFSDDWPKTVLFDLDGTLVDSAPDLATAVDQMLTALDRPPAGPDKVRQWVGNGAAMLVRRALADRFDHERATAVDASVFDDALARFFQFYTRANGRQARVYEGVHPFLQALGSRGCGLGVVTNKPGIFTGPLLAQMDLAHWFPVTVSGDTLATRKPDPAPIHHAIRQLGAEAGSTLMVGDSITDIRAARNAGIPVVAVRYGYHGGEPVDTLGADFVVDSLTELL
ncbi:MAG: phosphoglycolate phosphatase [Marinobacter sp.]|nr:phosphoglycolate phosphatase [Marinobacter sp.]